MVVSAAAIVAALLFGDISLNFVKNGPRGTSIILGVGGRWRAPLTTAKESLKSPPAGARDGAVSPGDGSRRDQEAADDTHAVEPSNTDSRSAENESRLARACECDQSAATPAKPLCESASPAIEAQLDRNAGESNVRFLNERSSTFRGGMNEDDAYAFQLLTSDTPLPQYWAGYIAARAPHLLRSHADRVDPNQPCLPLDSWIANS